MRPLLLRWHRTRRRVLLHRRLLAALLAGLAVLFGLEAASPEPPATQQVWTAARDLPSGTVLGTDDLRTVGFAAGTAPREVLGPAELVGRTIATPLQRGEPLTPSRLVGPGLAAGRPDEVVVPVRITDPAVVPLLRVGDRVVLVAVDPQDVAAGGVVASRVTVLAIPEVARDTVDRSTPGRLVVVAAPRAEGDTLAALGITHYVTVRWSR